MKKFKRRQYLINKPVQFSYMGIAVWFLLIGILLVGSLTYYITMSTILNALEVTPNVSIDACILVKGINFLLFKRIGLLLILLMLVTSFLAVFFLHRLAGPVYRMEKVMEEMSQGKKVYPVKLRVKDFFKPTANVLNKLIEYHNSIIPK